MFSEPSTEAKFSHAFGKVVKSGGKNIEVAVMTKDDGLKQLEEAEIDVIVTEIEAEKAAATEAAKNGPPKET
ncbi:hypothetical protein Dsin_001623 [Dipteronia sinensis]|uniref:Uncharacterized protein n=1 Tax=Dipteronia sinensis TaxID=43782 RepID=A0AAE0B4N6_9ROSI|nr:hypothetical protein Dsin_001623 [Dipteronia sinensis]